MTAGIILAAGESRRMGFPKALLPYRGSTFLDTLLELFCDRCGAVIVVTGAHAQQIGNRPNENVRFVVNHQYQRGMTSSLQCALRALPAGTDGVLFTLVDHPSILPSTVDALLAPSDNPLRVPRYRGERGHPIWFSRAIADEILAIPEGGAARDVIRAHYAKAVFLDVDDPGIVADIDDPAAYRALVGAGA